MLSALRAIARGISYLLPMRLVRGGMSLLRRVFFRPLTTNPIEAAAKAMGQKVQDNLEALGALRKKVTLPSGEEISYVEKPAAAAPTGSSQTTLIILHGMTADPFSAVGLAGEKLKIPASVRCLAPELRGHASRVAYTKASGVIGWTIDDYAHDVSDFLGAVGVGPNEKIDILGYSHGGSTALKLAELYGTDRIRKCGLLAPAIAIGWVPVQEARDEGKIRYAYASVDEARDALLILGQNDELAGKMGHGAHSA